ncbi:flagellin N-terminal helical domain-containing protein [Aneurinibacillus sp. REN35]|uniref:flagellin N-terminal helical domain-containing protein n=1 Tax=Aneurinibacillus sp. REN35 TaxID=3237286 RepID=UPI003528B603
MIINHNLQAMNSHRQLGVNNAAQSKSIEKLSSGLRINRAGDDAAGLAISEKMRGQIRGLDQASRNAQDGISLIQTAEGALNETHAILQRMRELAVQSSNDTNTDTDRGELQKEMDQLIEEIDRISNTTEFNTKKLLDGQREGVKVEAQWVKFEENNTSSFNKTIAAAGTSATSIATDNTYNVKITKAATSGTSTSYTVKWTDKSGATGSATVAAAGGSVTIGSAKVTLGALTTANIGDEVTFTQRKAVNKLEDKSLTYQIGANSSQTMSVDIGSMSSSALNVSGIKVTSAQAAEASISGINRAIEQVSAERSKLGSFQNRLEHSIKNLDTASENLQASESRIRDVDMAKEMMNQTKNSILSQAAQAMLAQANQAPQGVLQLLR